MTTQALETTDLEALLYRIFAGLALIAVTLMPATPALSDSARMDRAVAEFRTLTGGAAVWSRPALREKLLEQLRALHDDGLDPQDYGLDALRTSTPADPCFETLATRAYLHALDDLRHGRLDPQTAEPMWHAGAPPARADATNLARRAADGLSDPASAFESARPPAPAYAPLRRHLSELHALAGTPEPPHLPEGVTLRAGMTHPAVLVLRDRLARHGHALLPEHDPLHFDDALAAMLGRFQHGHHLKPDGVVGRATRTALNLDLPARITRTRANLERWRWLAPELLPTQIRVDIATAELRYLRNGELRWTSRVQVGRSERPTPLLHSAVSHITLHPPWVIPPTILRKDKLPAIRANPQVLEESGLRVFDRSGAELDPSTIDWNAPGPITLRQDPGPLNALGQVAIRFPNPFSVYLHDTPSQLQFGDWQRTFSSGCVRVERAVELAEVLLSDGAGITAADVAAALQDGTTRNLRMLEPISILLAYWTADVDGDGALRWRTDSYARDPAIVAALDRTKARADWRCPR